MSAPVLDWLVVTAANAAQARAYEAQLAARERAGALRPVLGDAGEQGAGRWLVVPDAKNRRIGSGGSTLMVLHELARRLERKPQRRTKNNRGRAASKGLADPVRSIADLFERQRILIIHSGGDAKRLPAYAAQGKVFTPLPVETRDGRAADLFDLVLEDLVMVMPGADAANAPRAGRVVIASGDLYLGLAGTSAEGLKEALARPGVVGVACPSGMDRGSRHGVFVRGSTGRVTDFLQKPSAAEAAARGALDEHGLVLVDTGVVSLDAPSVERWLGSAGVAWKDEHVEVGEGLVRDMQRGRGMAVDLYQHIMMALAAQDTVEAYLREVGLSDERRSDERRACWRLHEALKGSEFHVTVVPGCEFLHVGTTREFLEVITGPRWDRGKESRAGGTAARAVVYNSVVESVRSAGMAVVEGCLAREIRLRGDNVVVGFGADEHHQDPKNRRAGGAARAALGDTLECPRGWGVVFLPVGKKHWAAVIFGVDDDPKKQAHEATFGGEPVQRWMRRAGVSAEEVWGDKHARSSRSRRQSTQTPGDASLWTARLWRIGTWPDALKDAAWMMKAGRAPKEWARDDRWSMAEVMARVDHPRLIAGREESKRRAAARRVAARLQADRWMSASAAAEAIGTAAEAARAIDELRTAAEHPRLAGNELERARLLRACAVIEQRARAIASPTERVGARLACPNWDHEAFAAVARAVADAGKKGPDSRARDRSRAAAGILPDQVVWVTAPVRIDLAGGWSDTPPICQELGGSVVNAAITLNGQYPVQVMVRLGEQRRVRISSVDLGQTVTLTDAASVQDYTDPHDWTALAKAALVLSGLAPGAKNRRGASLANHLESFGGGIDVTLFSALPKGSGLGTSSVLGAALLAALDRFAGRDIDRAGLIQRTSILEQMMSTAGGWQDQVGGITPGVKILRTDAGPKQTPRIESIESPLIAGVDSSTAREHTPPASGFTGALSGRVLLYYTGYRRLARDILQKVVSRYLARDRGIVEIVHQLKSGAEEVRAALSNGDAEGFSRGVARYWELKKAIDPGSTNDRIEAIVKRVGKHLSAYELPGAGGGGFLFMIARDEQAALKVRTELERKPPNELARFYEFAIDRKGLSVAVL